MDLSRLTGSFYVNGIDETTLASVNKHFSKEFKAAAQVVTA